MKIVVFISFVLFLACSQDNKHIVEKPKEQTIKRSAGEESKIKEGIILKLNPKVGENYTFKVTIDQNIDQTIDTMKIKTLHNQTFVYSLQTKSNNPTEGIIFDAVFRSIQQKLQTPVVTIYANTNSKKEKDNPLETFYKSLIGKGFSIRVKQNGKNVELFRLDSLAQVVYRSLSKRKEISDIELEGLKKMTQEFFNPDEMKKNFEKTFEIYPDTPIFKNSQWKITKTIKQPIPAQVVNEYILESLNLDTALVALSSKIIFEKPKEILNELPNIKNMSGNQTGKLKIDSKSGMTVWGKFSQQIKIEYELPPSPQTNNKTLIIPMSIRTNFLYELIDEKQ